MRIARRFSLRLCGLGAVYAALLLLASSALAQAPVREAAEHELISESMTMLEIIETGGWIMYVLGAISIAGMALVFYFFTVIRSEKITPKHITIELYELLESGRWHDARMACRRKESPIGAVVLSAVDYCDRVENPNPEMVKEVIEAEGNRQAASMQNQIHLLLDIGVIAPMIGLLGTVLGMLSAFNVVAHDIARAQPMALAAGVSQALITTATGLLVGIPAMIFYAYFRNRTGRLTARLETVSAEMLTHIIQKNPES